MPRNGFPFAVRICGDIYFLGSRRITLEFLVGTNMDLIDTSHENRLVSTGPPVDSRECVGGIVSNGRIFYITQASGLQVCQVCGPEAASFTPPWQEQAP